MAGYTVTLSTVAGIAREFSQTDSNAFSNQLVFDFANTAMLKMRKLLIQKGIDAAAVQETYGTITDAVGEYSYPADMWLPKVMEVNFVNTSASLAGINYLPVEKVSDVNLAQGYTVNWLRINQSQQYPLVDYRGDTFEIFPTPVYTMWNGAVGGTLASAIFFLYYLQPTLYTDNTSLTDSLSYPENIDYNSFAKMVSAHYDYSIGRIDEKALENVMVLEVNHLIQVLQGEGRTVTKAKSVPWSGWEF